MPASFCLATTGALVSTIKQRVSVVPLPSDNLKLYVPVLSHFTVLPETSFPFNVAVEFSGIVTVTAFLYTTPFNAPSAAISFSHTAYSLKLLSLTKGIVTDTVLSLSDKTALADFSLIFDGNVTLYVIVAVFRLVIISLSSKSFKTALISPLSVTTSSSSSIYSSSSSQGTTLSGPSNSSSSMLPRKELPFNRLATPSSRPPEKILSITFKLAGCFTTNEVSDKLKTLSSVWYDVPASDL